MVEGSSPPARALLTGGSRPCDKSRYLLPAPPDICKKGRERRCVSLDHLSLPGSRAKRCAADTDPTTLLTGTAVRAESTAGRESPATTKRTATLPRMLAVCQLTKG